MSRSNRVAFLLYASSVAVFLVALPELAAQSTGREQPGGVLHRLDANGDGMLQPEEVPDRAKPLIRRIAERSGLDPNRPLPIDQLGGRSEQGSEADDERPSRGDRGRRADDAGDRDEGEARDDRDGQPDRNGRGRGERDDDRRRPWWDWSDDDRPRRQPDAVPTKVPGFGVELALSRVPGFDVPHSVTSQAGPTLAELEQSADRRTLWFARRLLEMTDENGNQIVDPAEWERLRWRGDANELDTNKDGRLTLPELIQGVARQREERDQSRSNRDGEPRGRADRGGQLGASGQAEDETAELRPRDESQSENARDQRATSADEPGRDDEPQNERRNRRVARRTRSERPQRESGPSWFRSRDRNRDGQVAMYEYATRWDERIVAEFNARDADGDGVISLTEASR